MSKKESPQKKKCSKCGKERFLSRDFYMSNSDKHSDGRISVCKPCINKDLEITSEEDYMKEEFIKKVKNILLDMNRPYIHDVWISSVEEAKKRNRRIFGVLMKNINLNHRDKNWLDSEFADENKTVENSSSKEEKTLKNTKEKPKKKLEVELDTQNEKDVLRLLGYDPFEYESEEDRPNLFNKLIDYLDESTLEDGFRLSSVIEIVRTFNQIDKINAAISKIMSNTQSFAKSTGSITSLVNAKDKMMKSALDIAKENTISLKHSSNKSKGAGTLSGIIKQLQEHDIHEASVNLFDIETAEGIRQVADLSNQSIMQQLSFDENDYSEMLREQRELLQESIDKANKFEEKYRLLKVELSERDKKEKELEEEIKDLKNKIRLLEDI